MAHLQELANVLVHEDFHGRNLEANPRQILPQLLLVHYLDGDLLARDSVRGQLHLGEAAGADRLVQLVEPVQRAVAVTPAGGGGVRRAALLLGRHRRRSGGGGLSRCRHLGRNL